MQEDRVDGVVGRRAWPDAAPGRGACGLASFASDGKASASRAMLRSDDRRREAIIDYSSMGANVDLVEKAGGSGRPRQETAPAP
jgi:hypothetical protein